MKLTRAIALGVTALLLSSWTATAHAQYLRIRDICRVKGQEENTLHGLGLVVGLKGTGDTDGPTLRMLAKMLELMGTPIGTRKGELAMDELKNAKNVAIVFVSATVPPEGARQGEQIHCTVNAISAKSLEGGNLLVTPLVGPRPPAVGPVAVQPRVYATAQGPIAMNESGPTTTGVIHDGCRLEEDFKYDFKDSLGYITLVIDRNHASFPTADAVQKAINGKVGGYADGDPTESGPQSSSWGEIAEAIDPVNVRVRIPDFYGGQYVDFIATLLDTQVAVQAHDARVIVNERNGVIVIGDNVMVGRVAVTHKNVAVQTGDEPVDGPFRILDQSERSADTATTRLKALVEALNALKANPQDIIDIIKSLERSGDLYGRLIVD